jgi:hypothetical protein
MKFTLKPTKPRNPFVAAVLRRAGGRHRPGAQRQQANGALRAELAQMQRSKHSP